LHEIDIQIESPSYQTGPKRRFSGEKLFSGKVAFDGYVHIATAPGVVRSASEQDSPGRSEGFFQGFADFSP